MQCYIDSSTYSSTHFRWGDAPEVERNFSEYNKYKNNYGHNIQIKAVPVVISKGHSSSQPGDMRKGESSTATSFDNAEEKTEEAEEKAEDQGDGTEEKNEDADENMELSV